MDENLIHTFSKKLLQKSIFPRLKDYLYWRTGKKDLDIAKTAPVSINLDLTTACNFQCPHCVDMELLNTGKILEWDYVQKLIRGWTKKGLKSVILIGGGEPTIYPHFEDTVRLLKELSLQVGLATNGTRMDKVEKVCHLFKPKDWVRLSLDAGTNETFQALHLPRYKITLEEVLAKSKEVKQKNPDLQLGYSFLIIADGKKVGSTLLRANIKEINLAAKLAKENGFSYISFKPFTDPTGLRQTTLSEQDLKEIREEINEAKKLESDKFKLIESINLRCFYDEELKRVMQGLPKICHIQFFRSIVIPAGIYNCANWRGVEHSKITDANKETIMDDFNAQKICGETACLYAPLNRWIEELINSPEKIEKLEPVDDFNDYFL